MFKKIEHFKEAKLKILHQFKNKKIINIFVECLMIELNEIEDALEQLNNNRSLKNAIGKQLKFNGKLRDIENAFLDDNTYKQQVLNRIALDNSDGKINSFLNATSIVLNSKKFIYKESYPLRIELFVLNNVCNIQQYKYIVKITSLCVSLGLAFSNSLNPFGYNKKICSGYKKYNEINSNKGGGYASIIGDLENE